MSERIKTAFDTGPPCSGFGRGRVTFLNDVYNKQAANTAKLQLYKGILIMTKMYKSFITALVLMLCIGATPAHAEGAVHKAVNEVSAWAYKVFEKDAKWVEKTAGKLYSEAAKGEANLRDWCGGHKETCVKEITKIAEDVKKVVEIVGEELIDDLPEIIEALAVITEAAA